MAEFIDIRIPYHKIEDVDFIKKSIRKKKSLPKNFFWRINKKSIDARKSPIVFQLRIEVAKEAFEALDYKESISKIPQINTSPIPTIVIIGAGPAGYFAALECLRLGMKPVVLERGKDVQSRRRDLREIQQFGNVNPNSNYCFGEGGAGTYSDGKLYTRSHKRGKIEDILQLLVAHGAKSDILIDAHPHIGSNKLPKIISNMRTTIESKGGEVHFDTTVVDFQIEDDVLKAVLAEDGKSFTADAFVLATGHSARDIYYLLDKKKIAIESKPFALGVRVEHSQALIDEIQYNQKPRSEYLPASSYKLVSQVDERGVFSFCMCPGGLIVPAATSPGEIVVNGMSLSKRDSPFANSGVVVAVENQDINERKFTGPLAHLEFQKNIETRVFKAGDGSQKAPAQRLVDFVEDIQSDSLNDSSYIPGLHSYPIKNLLPVGIYHRLRIALQHFGEKLFGYYTNEANIVAIESRTSAPVRIPRDAETLMHPQVENLFPCGEGAGYAGGILSAAMDGQNVVRAVHNIISS